jgi:hypothetical protein
MINHNLLGLYYHPVYTYKTVSNTELVRLSFSFYDNNSEAYDSATKLKAKLSNLLSDGTLINCNGYLNYNNKTYAIFLLNYDINQSKYYVTCTNISDGGSTAIQLSSLDDIIGSVIDKPKQI